jgi:hypothetical protein
MEFMKLPNEYVTMLEEHCEKLQEVGQKFGLMLLLSWRLSEYDC